MLLGSMLNVVVLVEEVVALLLVIEFRALLVAVMLVLAERELKLTKGNTVCIVFKLCKGTYTVH